MHDGMGLGTLESMASKMNRYRQQKTAWMKERRAFYRFAYLKGEIEWEKIPKAYRSFKKELDPDLTEVYLEKLKEREIIYSQVPIEARSVQLANKWHKFLNSGGAEKYKEKKRLHNLEKVIQQKRKKDILERAKRFCLCCGLRKRSKLYKLGTDTHCGDCVALIEAGLKEGKTIAMICGTPPFVEHWEEKYERRDKKRNPDNSTGSSV